ncbi:MAG: hypothetical protein QOI62_2945 [Solirubrobacteraceae bacterium]|jgi:hypothetical protein|nr:hypothetical protein [Solirubrobacteraceae bacterium]
MTLLEPAPAVLTHARTASATGRRSLRPLAIALPEAAALALWIVSLQDLDLRSMTSVGLVSVLPVGAFVALALLGTSFCLTLRRARPAWGLLVLQVLVLVFMLYALPALVEGEPRFAVTWRHIGVMQAILDTGHLDPGRSAYFNWPGFFALAGLAVRAAGLHGLLDVANWAPLAFELAYLGPLMLILRALTDDRRLRWLAIWIFYLGNWIGQDYLSPQAFAFLLYLAVLAVLLTWLRPRARGDTSPSGARAGLVAIVLVLFAAMVPSHQLTPFALLSAVTALVVARRCSARGLPVAMSVVLGAFLSYLAVGYLSGHTQQLFGEVGQLDSTVSQNVAGRLRGDAGHLLVTHLRLGVTAGLWTLAVAGALLRRRAGHRDAAPALLLLAPFPLAVLQPYGGEILLRVFLFSLPFTAFFAAAVLRRVPIGVTIAATLTLLGGFMVTRYGNERMDWFSGGEVAAVQRLEAVAPPGSTLMAWSGSLPWESRGYALHRFRLVVSSPAWPQIVGLPPGGPAQLGVLARLMHSQPGGAYLVLTRSQKAEVDLTGLGPRGSLDRVDAGLRGSRSFRLLYANGDGSVYALAGKAPG